MTAIIATEVLSFVIPRPYLIVKTMLGTQQTMQAIVTKPVILAFRNFFIIIPDCLELSVFLCEATPILLPC